ncbi:hypothetical protein GH714_036994 [Hevea brasiliensis]|uniref:Protein FAR1-RELATED SEQUENCE n=1 Tax=Hevea brasiliensis TaxID=3981 RepID=A0A6A6KM43_HEVBR|nr:hypothetical protein GH714_036936 [Hevea brasiliensis]KAF2289539.1 hypothetical protein GH714_036994 [Hevea brasiliensis]
MQESQLGSDGQRSNIHEDEIAYNVEEGPKSGMHFPTMDNLVNFYKEHGRLKGFSIVIRPSSKGNGSVPKYVLMTCDKGNKPHDGKYTKRVNCPARISDTLLDNGLWVVGRVITNHVHQLDPSMSRFMARHRCLSNDVKRSLEANDIARIRPSKGIRLLEVQSDGLEKMGCLPKDCRNFIYNRRRLRLDEGDAESIRKLFSKVAYEEFHDVICFDTTYLVIRYLMPFATFVGVNHHGQSILLGCALLSHEDVETFKWVFSTWLSAMGNTHPHVMLTDQCKSISAAIWEVMPETRHRFCLWHILSKFSEKFKGIEDFTKATNKFKALIFDTLTIEMFENWNEFLIKYGLKNNEWLMKLYFERESWVPIYLNHVFWAGMMSTQRSEGMHAYFDGYVNSRSTLKQFIEKYEMAICGKTEKELLPEFISKNKVVNCISQFKWEKQFQHA